MYDSELVMDLASSVHQILGLLMVLRTSLGSNLGPDHATTTINQLRPGCLQWNEELISTLFNTRDRESISKSRNIEDPLYWNLNRNGIYTVKSGYRALQNELMDDSFGIWKRLWQIHVPPKVKIFLWRVRSSVLLTADLLQLKHIHVDPLCLVYIVTTQLLFFWLRMTKVEIEVNTSM